ncbi:MAG: GGDEF domain-containing protein [Bacteriovoracales bacterium]|nr:GGDEF domain-containing protein [Bacteriovoracales bacterium]
MGNNEDTTVVFTDINRTLKACDEEADEKNACLLAIGGELNGTIFELPEGIVTMGRALDNTYTLEFDGISRHHLQFKVGEGVTLFDMGSRNGSFLNNKPVKRPVDLSRGDVIKMGVVALKFIPKGDPERLTYDKLNREANTDGLTGCYNKSYFNQACDLAIKRSKVTGKPLSLIIFDIDYFKKLNDENGHDAGDHILTEMAKVIKKGGVRDGDVFARYGGEEFVILLPNTNLKQSYEIAERIRGLVEETPFRYEDKPLSITVSVGVADYRLGVNTGVDLFKRADRAVYASKNGGRNQVNFFRQ